MSLSASSWIAPGDTRLGFTEWSPGSQTKALIVAMHGLGCRDEDFAPLGETLRKKGMTLAAWNLRGQGLDPIIKRRGAWLDCAGMLRDLASFVNDRSTKGIPLFLGGESMGALLALHAAVRKEWRHRVSGLLLFSPVVGLAQRNPAWMKSLLRAVSAAAPGLRLKPGWFVHGSGALPKITRIPERQEALALASHRLGPLTLHFLANMGDLIESAPLLAEQLEVPVALFSVGQDVFVTPRQSYDFFARIRTPDKMHFHYPESYHQLMFDLDAEKVLADAAEWIEARIFRDTSP